MQRTAFSMMLAAGMLATAIPVAADAGKENDSRGPLTLAVYGDSPYGTSNADTAQFNATPAFIATINADRGVSRVVHIGDIHSGKQKCTQAYDQPIYAMTDPITNLGFAPASTETCLVTTRNSDDSRFQHRVRRANQLRPPPLSRTSRVCA